MTGMVLSVTPSKARAGVASNLSKVFRKHWVTGMFTLSLFIGMIWGALFSSNADMGFMRSVDFLFSTSFSSRLTGSVYQTYISSLAANFIFLSAAFLMGLSLCGAFLLPLVSLFKGFGIGLTAGYLCSAYMLKGVAFYLLMLLPAAFLSVIALIMTQKEGFHFSCRLIKLIAEKSVFSQSAIKADFSHFLKKCGRYLIVSALASLLDVGAVLLFARFFDF